MLADLVNDPKSVLKIQWELEQPISLRFLGLEVYCAELELLSYLF